MLRKRVSSNLTRSKVKDLGLEDKQTEAVFFEVEGRGNNQKLTPGSVHA